MSTYSWQNFVLVEWQQLQEKIESTKKEWETFMQGGNLGEHSCIAPEIWSSWQRCRDRNMNPYDDSKVVLSVQELKKRLDDNKNIIETLKPIVNEIMDTIKDSGYKIDFFDKDLYLLVRFGKKTNEGERRKKEPVPGESHKEKDVGTNATNMAALLEKPVQLVSYEHFRTYYHDLTCVGVPIMDKDDKLIGVLSIVGYCWPLHKHTMGALISIKRLVELKLNSLNRKEVEGPNILNRELLELIDSPVVVVDDDSKIVAVNSLASNTLLNGWASAIGFTSGTLWGDSDPFWEVLKSKKHVKNKQLITNQNGKNIIYTYNINPVIGPSGKCLGAIGIFKDKNINHRSNGDSSASRAYYTFDSIVGTSPAIKRAIKLAKETASLDNNVLILGESGTGKELFTQAIHNASTFSAGPFVAVNCSAIPNSLLESELFGYEGGSFTGAKKDGAPGKFELAKGGTIFLDEINSMSLDMQAKLLRVLQNKAIVRIGGSKEIPVNIRIIATSNVDLWELVQQGEFREDLYYRINVISITIPPLRQRENDIILLIDYILDRMSSRVGELITIDEEATEALCSYHWPGNVRELENVLERSWVIAKTNNSNKITLREVLEYRGIREEILKPAERTEFLSSPARSDRDTSKETLEYQESQSIREALIVNKGNVKATAEQLGVSRNTLYRKMKKYNIQY
jgi:transcriptional regulator with PAS, ATPase and Fis domain